MDGSINYKYARRKTDQLMALVCMSITSALFCFAFQFLSGLNRKGTYLKVTRAGSLDKSNWKIIKLVNLVSVSQ